MSVFLTWLLRLAIALIALAVVVSGGIYFLLTRSLPDYSKSYEVRGLNGPVEIIRDRYAIPHIFGRTDEDVFFGLGFVHAQDRLWQMTLSRRAAHGRLSELFGEEALASDRLIRRLDIHGLSVPAFEAQDEETQAALIAYSQGVNAWLEIIENSIFNDGAPEFLFFDGEIRPWEPFDSIAILNLQALELSSHAEKEARRARAAALVDPDRLKDLMPGDPASGLVLPFTELSAINDDAHARDRRRSSFAISSKTGGASNMWAAAPDKTSGGASLLANDPHLGFTAPSAWMLARLELSDSGVIGATIPGIPMVVVGRNMHLAWGLTSSYVDDQDIFLEKYDPESEQRYLTPEGSSEFRSRFETIAVKGGTVERIELKWTENGPVIPAEVFGLDNILPRDQFTSLGWTLLNQDNRSMSAGIGLMKAINLDEALGAVRQHHSPQLNILIASRDEIAMQVIGTVPRRNVLHETQGTMPAPGWKQRNRWQGTIPYNSLPRFRNPQNGFLGNTNNKIIDRQFPDNLSHDWGDSFRFLRLQELLAKREIHSVNSFSEMQLDTLSFAARILVPEFARNLWHTSDTLSDDNAVQLRNSALKLLFGWDGEMQVNRPEPLIYAAWARSVQRRLIEDELGLLAREFARPDPNFLERVFRDVDGAAAWCDIVHSQKIENCDDIALLALDEALSQLRKTFGNNVADWRWGDAHQAQHDHTIFGGRALFSWLFNIRQPVSGGDNTLNMGQMSGLGEHPYRSLQGASYRGIYDFSDLDASQFVLPTGQSGHPFSRHFDDQSQLWKAGGYAIMSLDPVFARANSVGIMTLEPARE